MSNKKIRNFSEEQKTKIVLEILESEKGWIKLTIATLTERLMSFCHKILVVSKNLKSF